MTPPRITPSPAAPPGPLRSHTPRALAHARRGRALLLLALLAACGPGVQTSSTNASQRLEPHKGRDLITPDGRLLDAVTRIPRAAPVPAAARSKLRAFLEAMVQPPLDATSDIHDEWFHRTKRMLDELMAAEEAVGNAALHAFCGDASDYYVTRRALLMIGAHAAPASAAPLLHELTFEYGYRIEDRTEACLLLPVADPEGYLAKAGPYLERRGRKTKTMPDDEFMMRAWIESCENTQRSPVDMCADVATNLFMQPMARYMAATELGKHTANPIARQALETCLIESTGDGVLRIKAAQAIAAGFPREQSCALFEDVLSKEVSIAMRDFLVDMIDHHCKSE